MTWQVRLREEAWELANRLDRLRAFRNGSPEHGKLSVRHRGLLTKQQNLMYSLLKTLEARLNLIDEEERRAAA